MPPLQVTVTFIELFLQRTKNPSTGLPILNRRIAFGARALSRLDIWSAQNPAVTDMALPPQYKYLDVNGAKLTLGNRTFRHAKPSTFKDLEDMTVQSVFPEEVEAALATLSNGCVDVILENVNEPPTCNERLRASVTELQGIFRQNPDVADAVREELRNNPEINVFDVEHMRGEIEAFLKDINEFMQGHRVLCVTTDKASERMWKEYSENHKGIALRIEGNVAKDSKFQKFAPVTYHAVRPPLYDRTLDFMKGSLFGD